MKILIIGGHGTIGSAVSSALSEKHEIIIAGRSKGDITVDLAQADSIEAMFGKVGKVDAVICIAGAVVWAPLVKLTENDFYNGIKNKMMGQVNLVRTALNFINPKGSITLTTGILGDYPVYMTSAAALINGGINSFVKAVAIELENGIRINAVSPGMVEDSVDRLGSYFPGYNAVTMKRTVNGYIRSVEGRITGEVIRIYQ